MELPSLGDIVRGWAIDGRLPQAWNGTRQDYSALVWERYNATFQNRVDYRLWRDVLHGNKGPHARRSQTPAASWIEEAIEHPEPLIGWGVIAVVAGLLTGRQQVLWSTDELALLASACERRLFGGIEPPVDAVRGCAVVKIFAFDAIQKVREQSGVRWDMDAAESYLATLTRWFRELDPQWRPGRAVWLKDLKKEESYGHVIVPLPHAETSIRLTRVLHRTRGVIQVAATDGSGRADALLIHGAKYALSAWLTARLQRLGSEKLGRSKRGSGDRYDSDRLAEDEMTMLWRAAQAARDTGDYLSSARLAHLLLRVIPSRIVHGPAFSGIADKVSASIREAGLEIDERFTRDGSLYKPRLIDDVDGAAVPEEDSSASAAADIPSPFARRLERDQETDPRWIRLLEEYPIIRGSLRLRLLPDAIENGQCVNEQHLRDAYDLSLRYGHLRTAGKILGHVVPRTGDVVGFASAVDRSFETNPFGIDGDRQAQWRDTLRGAWALHEATVDPTPEQGLLLHEVLLGRSALLLRGAPGRMRRLLARKYYDRLPETDLRALYRSVGAGPRSRRPRLHGRHLVRQVRRLEELSGSPVVLVSLVAVDDSRWSMITVDRTRCRLDRPRSFGEVLSDAAHLRKTHALWRWHLQPIAWPGSIAAVGKAMVARFAKTERQSPWLVLAVDPRLATLPWQDLFTNWLDQDLVVSIIPTLGWLETITDLAPFIEADRRLIDRSPEFGGLREGVTRGMNGSKVRRRAAGVVVGHGVSGAADIPSVVVDGHVLGMEDWLEVGRRPTVLVYSCSTGAAEAGFLGDLGGLPGVLLGTGCEVLLAPITDVNISTAEVLNRCLCDHRQGATLGQRYLAAVKEDPAVALFTVYGMAGNPL